jgi:hypothetical protein
MAMPALYRVVFYSLAVKSCPLAVMNASLRVKSGSLGVMGGGFRCDEMFLKL